MRLLAYAVANLSDGKQEDLEKAIQNCSEVALQNDREKMSKCHRVLLLQY